MTDLAHDPVAFFDDYIKVNERGQPFRLREHQREILRAAFTFDTSGRLPWDTFIFSCLKKSGKTTINAGLTVWWAYTQEPPNEVFVLANDAEQAEARAYATAAKLIRNNPALDESAVSVDKRRIVLSNGTTIIALASEVAGSAGSNHGLTSWDELWGYTSETSRRLFEELTGVPTRRNSIRLITTYAGWSGESKLLWDLYLDGVGPDEHPDGKAERVHPTLPLYLNREARIFAYWDHQPRMKWQAPNYYAAQRKALRPSAYRRLHENRWADAESTFIAAEMWDACTEPTWSPMEPTIDTPLYVGVDASYKNDSTAVVGVVKDDGLLIVATHRIWRPSSSAPLDLGEVEDYLRHLARHYRLGAILVDPYQMVRSISVLKQEGLPIVEWAQTPEHLTEMATTLSDVLNARSLVVYPSDELREQALNTVAIEGPRGWKIAKERGSRKIDAMVALAMACVAAVDAPVFQSEARVW